MHSAQTWTFHLGSARRCRGSRPRSTNAGLGEGTPP
jgi:hypothetical protein